MPLLPSLPDPAHLGDLIAAFPKGMRPLIAYVDALLRGESDLTIGERELIAAYTSALNACRFCHQSHALYTELFGVDPARIDALMADPDAAPYGEKMKPLLAYVAKLNSLPARLVPADAEAVLAAGWSEAALFDAIQINALFNLMNRMVEGAGVNFDYDRNPDAIPDRADRGKHAHTYLGFADRLGLD